MAILSTSNGHPPGDAYSVFEFKRLITFFGGTWVIHSQSDGTGAPITHGGSGPGGMNNDLAWVVIQRNNRFFCIQRVSAAGFTWRIKYSSFPTSITPGTPTITPIFSNQTVILGSGTDAAPIGAAWLNSGVQAMAVSMSNTGGEHYFFFHSEIDNNSALADGGLIFDDLEPSTYKVGAFPNGDEDPTVIILGRTGASPFQAASLLNAASADVWGFFDKTPTDGGSLVRCSAFRYDTAGSQTMPASLGTNKYNFKLDVASIRVGRGNIHPIPVGYKGTLKQVVYSSRILKNGIIARVSSTKRLNAAGDLLGPFGTTVTAESFINDASNTTPIVITTAVPHQLVNGDKVFIENVSGNTAANGEWFITVLSPTTFQLNGSAGNGAFVSTGNQKWSIVAQELLFLGPASDVTPPFVIGFSPRDTSTDNSLNPIVEVFFNEPMTGSILGVTSLKQGLSTVPVIKTLIGNIGVRMIPLSPLAVSTVYTIEVLGGYTDLAGNVGGPSSGTFTTTATGGGAEPIARYGNINQGLVD